MHPTTDSARMYRADIRPIYVHGFEQWVGRVVDVRTGEVVAESRAWSAPGARAWCMRRVGELVRAAESQARAA